MNDSAAAQIEQIFAHPAIACASALPSSNMCEGVFHSDPFTQLGASLWRLLTLSQFDEQGFIRVNADAASFGVGGALGFQGTLRARLFGKMHHPTRHKRHFLLGGAPKDLSIPIEGKRLFVKAFALAHRPGEALDLQLLDFSSRTR